MKKSTCFILLLLLVSGFGCQKSTLKPHDKSEFNRNMDALVLGTVESCRAKLAEISPAAVVYGNALNGRPHTRLDEIIGQRLIEKLSSDREIIALSRENWFEFKESRPLSVKGHSGAHSDLMENIVVFVIDIEPQPLFDRIKVLITAKDSKSRPIPGVRGQAMLAYFKDSPATLLLSTLAHSNPLPEGLKKNPYSSMEQMSYSLAAELSDALERGVTAGKYKASDQEIQVVLCAQNFSGPNPLFNQALVRELQQALVSMDGMTTAVSRNDFAQVFSQMDLYEKNDHLFEGDTEKFKPGSVLLMAETKTSGNQNQVALRAVWRLTPLRDKTGAFIPENSAGTYISGFTSRAWFEGQIPKGQNPKADDPPKIESGKNTSLDKGFD